MFKEEMTIKLLSPAFCGGADQNAPEIRAPSIRGHLRRWHTLLYGEADMKIVWGSVGKKGGASQIQLRVAIVSSTQKKGILLPHKTQGSGSRKCLDAEFTVFLSSRKEELLKRAYKALEAWSLLGALGTRANRAAGSIWPLETSPCDLQAFRGKVLNLTPKIDIRVSKETESVDILRKASSDTLSISHLFGSAKPRKDSPLKVKMVEFSDGLHLLLWAGKPGVIDSALRELENRGKPLADYSWEKIK